MKALIIEDEKPASDKIVSFLQMYDEKIEVSGILESVAKSVEWFRTTDVLPDIIFMDVQLSDGICFDIFDQVTIKKPIIFTTAFNQYAVEAFKQNSIGYLLKPFNYQQFYQTLKKLESLGENLPKNFEKEQLEKLQSLFSNLNQNFKTRFMVKVGEHLRSVQTENIALFSSEGRDVTLITSQGKRYIVDYKMEELENILNPEQFFRLGRSFIVNINFIADTLVYSNSRLKVTLTIPFEEEIIVSREKVRQFKEWFDGME
jgi:two-component system, LytTR family, response regulator